jgi:hypothetical protein
LKAGFSVFTNSHVAFSLATLLAQYAKKLV